MSTVATQELPSVCPLDCPDTCSLKVTVEEGVITKVRGSQANPFTKGSVCSKVAKFYPQFVHGDKRLKRPLIRTGVRGSGEYKPVSWQQAIEHIYQNTQRAIERHGEQTVMPLNYAGPHGKLAGGSMDVRFFSRLGATDLDRSPLCGGVKGLAYKSMFGKQLGMPPEQLRKADLIIIWGTNVSVTNLHLMREINHARQLGAKLVVIDPRKTRVAKQADLYLQIKPGADVSLALKLVATLDAQGAIAVDQLKAVTLGLAEYLEHARGYRHIDTLSECGVSEKEFNTLVDFCAQANRLAMSVGVGLERTRNGGSAIRAAYALPVLLGNLGEIGQGILASYGPAFNANGALTTKADLNDSPERRVFNIVDVADHLLDRDKEQPVDVVFIYNHNPVATHPDQNKLRRALSQESLFIVGCDVEMNDSMLYADVILPACTHFEHSDVFSAYGHGYLQRADAVIPAVGEAKSNTEIFRLLAKRFGFNEPAFNESDADLIDQAFIQEAGPIADIKLSELDAGQVIAMQDVDYCWLEDFVKKERGLGTPSGKIELYSAALEQAYQSALPTFKAVEVDAEFILISPASDRRTNATFGGQNKSVLEPVEINPQDAARKGITSGDKVRLNNALGEVDLVAKVTEDVAIGVLCCEKGAWCDRSETGQSVNALISNQCKTDIGEGAAYYDTFVDIQLQA